MTVARADPVLRRARIAGSENVLVDVVIADGNLADIVVLDASLARLAVAELSQPLFAFKRGRRTFTRPAGVLHRPD
jgi:hypothetical protein